MSGGVSSLENMWCLYPATFANMPEDEIESYQTYMHINQCRHKVHHKIPHKYHLIQPNRQKRLEEREQGRKLGSSLVPTHNVWTKDMLQKDVLQTQSGVLEREIYKAD